MSRKLLFFLLLIILSAPCVSAQNSISLFYNGSPIETEQPPLIKNSRTLVPVRSVCEAMGLTVNWDSTNHSISINDEFNNVIIGIGNDYITVNTRPVAIDAPAEIINGCTLVPIRSVIEPFGASLNWDSINHTINIFTNNEQGTVFANMPRYAFYSQPDERWGFESSGRGYCWVCSYAMLITNLTGTEVTPANVAEYNLSNGGQSGSYMMSHLGLASAYSLKFTPALNQDSPYFESFENSRRGATYIKAGTDDDVRLALKEALTLHPKGVMVRFEGYPHTLVATYEKDMTIYFNDPAKQSLENVPFSGTCLAKNFTLKDISFIQALTLE